MSGLYFSSYEVIQDQRTSLNLTPSAPFSFPSGFTLAFDINIRRGSGFYGYIFRIIGNDYDNIDLVFNQPSDISNLWLVYKDEILVNYKWEELPSFDYDQWMNVQIDFDLKSERLTVLINEKKQEIVVPGIKKLKDFFISFGACRHKSFYSTDVCPMIIRNIHLYKPDGKLYRQWELGKHAQNKAYDVIAKAEATVENPHWLIDRYLKWMKAKDIHIPNLLGITNDAANKRLFFVNEKFVFTLHLETLQLDSIQTQGSPYRDPLCKNIIYNKYTDEIWSYSFVGPVSRFSFKTNEWSAVEPGSILAEYAHHNRFFSPVNQSLVTILGYGHYEYKSIVNIYDPTSQGWEKINRNDQIAPRYLSSAGFLDERKVLVFGGYGSKSGRQELSPAPYFDLHTFNLDDYSFSRKWIMTSPAQAFVPSETLVADPSSGLFYVLLFNNGHYNTHLQLAQFSIDKPEMKFLGDSIPYKYKDTDSWTYLLLNEHQSKLVAIVSHADDISLYTLAYKPLMIEDTLQPTALHGALSKQIIQILLLLLFIAGIVYAAGKKFFPFPFNLKKRKTVTLNPLPPIEKRTSSSFYLLGGFHANDRNGEDITSLFSPTLKQLFLLILLSSTNKKGVRSAMLDEILWHDKIGESARNNRNVNMSKLRSLLEGVEGVEVINTNSLWTIRCSDKVYCDYLDIISFATKVKNNIPEEKEVYHFLALLRQGDLLSEMPMEWLRPFKESYIKEIIDVLTILLNMPAIQRNISLHYHTAESLLNIDASNDEALSIVCSNLHNLRKQSLAKLTYDTFVKRYEQETGTTYPVSYNKLIRQV